MGKRRKSGRSSATEGEIAATDNGESRKRIRTFEDVADSDDEFHLNRDKILLEEQPAAKRQRKVQEEEEFLEVSEEEVLNHSDSASEEHDNHNESSEAGDEDQEEEEGWGTSKKDVYGADTIETEEQALEEEAEARRLQKKQLQSMSTADYGFDEDEWNDPTQVAKPAVITETLPEQQIPSDASPKERLKILKARYPEFEPLSRELQQLDVTVSVLAKTLGEKPESKPRARAKHNAASAYLGALTMYFALLTSGPTEKIGNAALPANPLRDHDIMSLLVDCRKMWQQVKSLPEDQIQTHDLTDDVEETDVAADLAVQPVLTTKKSRKTRHEEAVQAAKEARIAENLKRTEAENADLDLLLRPTSKTLQRSSVQQKGSDLDEEMSLTAAQAEEKARRRKSLRFYTSQISQKANKRGNAGRTAGGDDDIPHRERLRDRQARLNAEAEKRGKRGADASDDLGGDSDAEDAEQARKIRQAVDDDDEYYDMIAARTAKKKSDKIAYGEAQKRANEQGGVVVEQEAIGPDGKRKITYAIEKNKGLTPHRKKDVRNPRVKKRKKFEEKSKKLASMKATYKGGEGRGGYGGELTGIKTNLVKSTKL